MNKEFYEPYGYTKDEFVLIAESAFLTFFAQDYHEQMKALLAHFINEPSLGDYEECCVKCITREAHYCWIDFRSKLVSRTEDSITIHVALFNVTKQKEIAEQYRLFAQLSGRTLAHYEIATKTLTICEDEAKLLSLPPTLENVPYGCVRHGDISENTVDSYVRFYEDIRKGELSGSAMYQKLFPIGWRWVDAKFITQFDPKGKPISATISYADITEQYEKDAIYAKWQLSLQNRPNSSYTLYRCFLDQDISFNSAEGSLIRFPMTEGKAMTFDECSLSYVNAYVYESDRERYLSTMDMKKLKGYYINGQRKFTFEYREYSQTGRIRWIRRTVDLVERPDSSGIIAYLLFEDIDESKRAELDTLTLVETDALTGLLNRGALVKRLDQAIEILGEKSLIAFFILDMDGFKGVNDTYGHAAGDQLLIDTGKIIQSVLAECDLVGRLGGDEFVFCMLNVPNKDVIRKKARRIWKMTHRDMGNNVNISASIGISICPTDAKTFDDLYRMADKALYFIKENGKDNYGFYQDHSVHDL